MKRRKQARTRWHGLGLLVTVLTTMTLLASACGGSSSGGENGTSTPKAAVTVRMALNPSIAGLPQYVALDKGMFAQNGLDVTISNITDISTLPGIVGRQFDFALSVQPILLSAVANKLPVIVTAGGQFGTKERPNGLVLADKGSGITSPTALATKTIGVPTVNGNFSDCVLAWLKTNGVNPSSAELRQVAFANMADTLQSGKIDGAFSIDPYATAALSGGKVVSLGQPCLAISPTSQGTFLISNSDWASAHPDIVKKVQSSMNDAINWIETHTDEAKTILAKHTGLPVASFTNMQLPAYNSQVPVADLQAWIMALRGLGKLTGPIPNSASLIFKP